jgi:regulator of sigma E protease
MNIIYQLFTFMFVLGIIVLVHEFGHYIAARLMKIRVEVFSFGFGKRLFGKKVGATDFRVSLFPLGGYIRMAGDEEFDPEHPKADEFMAKNRAQKIFTLLMGPCMNVLLALLLIIIVNMGGVETDAYKLEKPVIGYIEAGSPAEKAGLLPGDTHQSQGKSESRFFAPGQALEHKPERDQRQSL